MEKKEINLKLFMYLPGVEINWVKLGKHEVKLYKKFKQIFEDVIKDV